MTALSQQAQPPLLELKGVSKRFFAVQAVAGADFVIRPGEVVGLIGENGAGKSTLGKLIAGVHRPDTGELLWQGSHVELHSARQAQDLGIAMIHQELNLLPNLSVEENLYFGREPRRTFLKIMDRHKLRDQALEKLAQVGLDVDPGELVGNLPIATRQRVEIAKALCLDAQLLIMDEPTSSLSVAETEQLLSLIGALRAAGLAIVYVSHKLEEIKQVSDRIIVMRDGHIVADQPAPELDVESLVRLMVGRTLKQYFPERQVEFGPEVFRVEGFRCPGIAEPVSFAVRAGEIVGISGLVGAGRSELLLGLFGATPRQSGQLYIEDKPVTINDPAQAIRAGMGFLPEDRARQGLILQAAIRENLTLPSARRLARGGIRNKRAEAEVSATYSSRLRIRMSSDEAPVLSCSGGNQQKVVLAKWLALEPRILLLDEPTRGIDVGAKVEIYELMNELAGQGVALVMVSSELEEVLGMSDTVVVMRSGRRVGQLPKAGATQEGIMALAAQGGEG